MFNRIDFIKWVSSLIFISLVVAMYTATSDFQFTEVVDTSLAEFSGLSLYVFIIYSWITFIIGRLSIKALFLALLLAIVSWHFSVWDYVNKLSISLFSEGYDGSNPDLQVFDKQSAVTYCFLLAAICLFTSGYRHNIIGFKFLSTSFVLIFCIIAGHHLISYWTIYKPMTEELASSDKQQLLRLSNEPDEVFHDTCDNLPRIYCWRFEVKNGYPSSLINFNTALTKDYIRGFANLESAKSPEFNHHDFQRDVLFENNFTNYYNRSILFNQKNGIATYIISGSHTDVPDSILNTVGFIGFLSTVFWVWIYCGIGYAHQQKHKLVSNFSRSTKSKRFSFAFLMTCFASPFLAWIGIDFFFEAYPVAFPLVVLSMIVGLYKFGYKSISRTITSTIILMAPVIYVYGYGVGKALSNGTGFHYGAETFLTAILVTTVYSVVMIRIYGIKISMIVWKCIFGLLVLASMACFIGNYGVLNWSANRATAQRLSEIKNMELCDHYLVDACSFVTGVDRVKDTILLNTLLSDLSCIVVIVFVVFINLAISHPPMTKAFFSKKRHK